MFKKAQMKVFAIITGILIMLFIAVLGSINVIMRSVMQRQSKVILSQIAAGVEYNDQTNSFTFVRPSGFDKPEDNPPPEPPTDPPITKPADTTTVITTTRKTTTSTTTTTTTATTTTAASTSSTGKTTSTSKTTSEITMTPPITTSIARPEPPVTTTSPTEPPTGSGEQPGTGPWDNPWGNPWDNPWNNPWANPWNNPWNNPWFWYGWNQGGDQNGQGGEPQSQPNEYWHDDHGPTQGVSAKEELYGRPVALTMKKPDKDIRPHEQPPEKSEPVPKSLGTIDFFVVMADRDGNYIAALNNDELESDTAQRYINSVTKRAESSGMMDSFQFCRTEKENGMLIVFTDKSAEIDIMNKLLRTTIMIGALSVILLSAAAFFLSKKIMQPLKSAFNKQKQFISDASHELKTPLTVISANADVLSGEIGENKWLTYIKSQTDRMNLLVNDLLNLTRLENNTGDFIRKYFDLSKAVVNTALPFECRAFESNKKFEVNVDDGIVLHGSEQHIKQMTAILIDNALKYSNDGGTVRVSLKKYGDRKVLTVFNTGQGVKESEKEKIFERFYRSDASRNRATGGYGLGLAIANSIVEKHKFKINVESEYGKNISFIVTM